MTTSISPSTGRTVLRALLLLVTTAALLPLTLLGTATSAQAAGFPLPPDYTPPAGWEWYAHQWGGWSPPPPSAPDALIWEKKRAGLQYPSAGDLIPFGTTVTPVPYCHPDTGNGDDLKKAYTVPEKVTVTSELNRVSVVCIYGYTAGDPDRPYGWSKDFNIRLAPSQRPTRIDVSVPGQTHVGDSLQVSMRVRPQETSSRVPTGQISMSVDGELRGSKELEAADDGYASMTTGVLDPGPHEIVVEYAGEPWFAASEVTRTVKAVHESTLSVEPNPVVNHPGRPVRFTATVTSPGERPGPVGGTVTITEGDVELGEFPVVSGTAAIDLGVVPFPEHALVATYSGDDYTGGSHAAVQLSRAPWLSDVRVETRPYGSDGWQPAPTRSTGPDTVGHVVRDGNPVRLVGTLTNATDEAVELPVRVVGPGGTVDGSERTVSLAPDERSEYVVELDTAGRAWAPNGDPRVDPRDYTMSYQPPGGSFTGEIVPVVVDPLPVVLVHGFNSSAAAWGGPGAGFDQMLRSQHPRLRGYAVGDGQFAGTMDTGAVTASYRTTNTIAENAREVATYVEGVRRATGAHHVDVTAHSMGGLITRKYIADEMPISVSDDQPVVRHLVQMGTPNMGSPCADRMIEISAGTLNPFLFPQPASYQLTTHYLEMFNAQVTRLRGVELSNMVGTGFALPCGVPVDSDIVVPHWSARWILAPGDLFEKHLIHTSMTDDLDTVVRYVVPRLADASGTGARAARRSLTAAGAAAEAAPTFETRTLAVPADGTGEVTVEVPAGDRFGLTGVGAGVEVELVAPDGTVAGTATAADATAPFLGLEVRDPAPGRWTVRGVSTDGAEHTLPLAFWIAGNPLQLDVTTAEVGPAGRGTIVATLAHAGPRPADVTATLTDGTSTGQPVALLDDGLHGDGAAGDGRYGYRGDLPHEGDHLVTVRAQVPGQGMRLASTSLRVSGTEPQEPSAPPVIRTGPADARTVVGGSVTFAATADGDVTSYAWEVKAPDATTWAPLADAGTPSLAVSATSRRLDGTAYRVVVTGPGGSTSSSPASLRVDRAPTAIDARARSTRSGRVKVAVAVTAAGAVPDGRVEARSGRRVVGTAVLVRGRAVVTVTRPPLLHRGLRVHYRGGDDFRPSSTGKVPIARR